LNKRGDGRRLRTEIVEAAMRLLETLPVQSLSLRAIAREAGITAPAIYMHFGSRNEIILEVIRTAWRDLAQAMRVEDERAEPQGPVAQLRAQVHSYLSYALASPTRYELLFTLQPDPVLMHAAPQDQPTRPVYDVLEEAVKKCIGFGVPFILDDVFDMTVFIFVIAHGRVALSHAVSGIDFSDPDVIRSYVDTVLDAIVPWVPKGGPPPA
jgi:AcrR family transcriptional regulator